MTVKRYVRAARDLAKVEQARSQLSGQPPEVAAAYRLLAAEWDWEAATVARLGSIPDDGQWPDDGPSGDLDAAQERAGQFDAASDQTLDRRWDLAMSRLDQAQHPELYVRDEDEDDDDDD